MGRPLRTSLGGYVYYVVSKSRQPKGIFRTEADYEEFEDVLREAQSRFEPRLLAYCCLPSRWHMVVVPRKDGDLSKFMAWLVMTHSARWHSKPRREQTGGLYEPRYKSFPVQDNHSLLDVMLFVESSPSRERIVGKEVNEIKNWPWCSLRMREREDDLISLPPIALPENWSEKIRNPMPSEIQTNIEHSIGRGTPYGNVAWVQRIAPLMNLESTLRPRGRPRRTGA